MRNSIPSFIQGWIWWIAIAGVFYLLLGPKMVSLIEAIQLAERKAEVIEQHRAKLIKPIPTNGSISYRSFVLTNPENAPITNIQSDLLDLIQTSQARLIDLREVPTGQTLGSLSAIMYRVELEGDLKAVTEMIEAFGTSEHPILLDQLELRPLERSERPDRLVQLSATLTIWTGSI